MVKREVFTSLVDSKKAAILKTLLETNDELLLKEISTKSKVPLTSTFRIMQEFVSLDLVHRKEWKTSKVYSCKHNEKVDFLRDLFKEEIDILQSFVEQVKDFQGIQKIILHGKQEEGNLLLIGEYINSNRVQEVCDELNKKGADLTFLTVTPSQYEQMNRMGLYGETKVLR